MRDRLRALATCALAIPLAATAGAEPPAGPGETGTIVGSVRAHDVPAADTGVHVVELRLRTTTDTQGAFRFEEVPIGDYLVQATSPRLGTGLQRVRVETGQEARVDLALEVTIHYEAIVVTARPDARALSEIAHPVSVLAGEELILRLQPTLGETLAQQPGVSATYFGPGASRPVIRGLGGDRIRVLQDGVGVGDASNTSPDHGVSLDPLSAQRVEVVRGPATLLYGSSAVGGVVNVLDGRIPDAAPEHVVSGVVDLLGASVSDEWAGSARVTAGTGPLVVHGGYLRRQAEDLSIPGFAESEALRREEEEEGGEEGKEHEEEVFGTLPNSAIDNESGTVGASLVGRKGFFGLSWTGYDSLYGIPGGHAHEEGEGHEGEEDEEHGEEEGGVRVDLQQRRWDARGELSQPFSVLRSARVRFGATDYEHQELEGDEVGTLFLNDSWEGRLELLHRPAGAFTGSFGLQVGSRDFEAIGEEAFVPPTETRSFAVFAFEDVGRGPLKLQLGGRYEHQRVTALGDGETERTFDGLSGSAGVVYSARGGFVLGLTLALSKKLPNAEELYSNGPHIATGAFEVGDPDLEKETSLGVDLSISRRTGPVSGELSLFTNRFDDYIYESLTGEEEDGLPVVRYVQRDATFWGAELQTVLQLVHAEPHHLDLELRGDFVRAELRADDEPLPRIPPFRYGAALHYHGSRLDGRVEVQGTAKQDRIAPLERETDGYTFLNASLAYRFFLGRTVLQLLAQGRNLTDAEGRSHVSFLKDLVPLPGRDFRLSARLVF